MCWYWNRSEERFEWEGFSFEIVFYPGQTEFHAAILGEIDGRRVLFSGDSTYPLKRYLPEKEKEWMVNSVLRNSLTFSMHRKCADEFERLNVLRFVLCLRRHAVGAGRAGSQSSLLDAQIRRTTSRERQERRHGRTLY